MATEGPLAQGRNIRFGLTENWNNCQLPDAGGIPNICSSARTGSAFPLQCASRSAGRLIQVSSLSFPLGATGVLVASEMTVTLGCVVSIGISGTWKLGSFTADL
ncbi:MAG: hypothetical protein WDN49_03200 [Acetobacteraceae bacterium]